MITRDELLKMPAQDYMNAAQRAFFTALLESMRDEIQARDLAAEVSTDDVLATPDPADRATLEEERALAFKERERALQRLRDIRAALARLERDEFGYCQTTGEEIGLHRLLANPTATRSIEAQLRAEQADRLCLVA